MFEAIIVARQTIKQKYRNERMMKPVQSCTALFLALVAWRYLRLFEALQQQENDTQTKGRISGHREG